MQNIVPPCGVPGCKTKTEVVVLPCECAGCKVHVSKAGTACSFCGKIVEQTMPLMQYSMQMAMKMFSEKPGMMQDMMSAIQTNDADKLKSVTRRAVVDANVTEADLAKSDAAMEELMQFKKEGRAAEAVAALPGTDEMLSSHLDLNKLSDTDRGILEGAAKAHAEQLGLPLQDVPDDRAELESTASVLGLVETDTAEGRSLALDATLTSLEDAAAAAGDGGTAAQILEDAMRELGL